MKLIGSVGIVVKLTNEDKELLITPPSLRYLIESFLMKVTLEADLAGGFLLGHLNFHLLWASVWPGIPRRDNGCHRHCSVGNYT